VYRSVHALLENCGKVELKIATYNICLARVSRAQKRVFVYVPDREKVRMNRSTVC
jgi:hypothetical protein